MKYISIDTETTGLNPDIHQVLQIGAIIEDTENPLTYEECPKFEALIWNENFNLSPGVYKMNEPLLKRILAAGYGDPNTEEDTLMLHEAIQRLYYWARDNDAILLNPHTLGPKCVFAGANFGAFDLRFLQKTELFEAYFGSQGRYLEPSMFYFDWKSDGKIPSLQKCLDRAGIQKAVAHDALSDAWDVICLLRKQYADGWDNAFSTGH